MTNYEKIMDMSVEEIAEMLAWQIDCGECSVEAEGCQNDINICEEQQKKWLESEAEK